MTLSGLLTAVAPWRSTPEAENLFKLLKPLGDLEQYKFEDWRNRAVLLDGADTAWAVYSRPGEAFAILGNFNPEAKTVICRILPRGFPFPLSSLSTAEVISGGTHASLDAGKLGGSGESVMIPSDGALVLRLR
jgi:hypothetical protein